MYEVMSDALKNLRWKKKIPRSASAVDGSPFPRERVGIGGFCSCGP